VTSLAFGNPTGFLALFALAGVVLVHLLRARARRVSASTLFLVEEKPTPTRSGRVLARLRATPLFWLQIFAVALLTWVLVEPRWLRDDSTLRVVLVVDGSASMSAFGDELDRALETSLPRVARASATTEWIVLASDPTERTLYSGSSLEEALGAVRSWPARLPGHDPRPVLEAARSVASDGGLVLFLTDHVVPVPAGTSLLAVGHPISNVGFAGVEVREDGVYRAIVKSSAPERQTRRWWIEREGGTPEPGGTLDLSPGELRFVTGTLPPSVESVSLVLEGDRFALDDRLPLVRPRPKRLRVFVAPELDGNRFVARFVETLEPVERVAGLPSADLALTRTPPPASGPAAIVFPQASGTGRRPRGPIVSESDPLLSGLDFQGLVVREIARPRREGERTLLWQGEDPLLSLASPAGGNGDGDEYGDGSARGRDRLDVSFPLDTSNADRIPSFVLLLHRFADEVRSGVVGFEQRNVELHQRLVIARTSTSEEGRDDSVRAPGEPGFFDARDGATVLFRGAAHFADVAEADLSRASTRELDPSSTREAALRNSLPDPLRALWLLALGGVAMAAWRLQEREG
jgi:Aerotolerance regulator N-terminal